MRFLAIILASLLFGASALHAEEKKATEVVQSVIGDPETARSGLLVLQFAATGMTDSAARAYSTMIAQNVANTNRFIVTDHEQAEQVMVKEAPNLLPCFEIGCGIQMAKILGAERVMSGHISLDRGFIELKVKLVNVMDNEIEFEESTRFDDNTMDRRLYSIAQAIAMNTPLRGQIIRANETLVVIGLGSNDGVRVGDRMVIYKNLSVSSEQMTAIGQGNTRRANLGILSITKVGGQSSEGTYFQKIEAPHAGEYVLTYLDKRKQISLISYVRKELDTHLRHAFEVEKEVIIQPISLLDQDKNTWIRKVRHMEQERDWWQMWMTGTSIATGYYLVNYKNGDEIRLMALMGGLSYSAIEYFGAKANLKQLVQEGKFKGYLEPTFNPNISKGALGIRYQLNF